MQPVLVGALFLGVLSALPFINLANCCCLWIVGGGYVAGYLSQQPKLRAITTGEGARVGLAAGLAGAFIYAIVSLPIDLLLGPLQARIVQRAVENARDLPPGLQEALRNMAAAQGSLTYQVVVRLLPMLVIGAVFAPIGGVLAAVFTRPPREASPSP
jgi:hypothetical protein